MKKIITTCLLMSAVALCASAHALNETEAMNIAREFLAGKTSTRMSAPISDTAISTAFTARSVNNENLLYVFNRGNDNGFVIVAGDDEASNTILGYSDNGSFDYNNIPDNMRWWIDQYANQIEQGRHNRQQAKSETYVSKFNKNVGPLVEARWSQDAPYNNMCPMFSNTARSATGCVATAMAQIMYHHKYPEHGVGSKEIMSGNSTEVVDFANTTYQWDLMTPVYSSLSTKEECDAVATLMYHVGRSVNMMYSDVSGAVSAETAPALATYWDYDKAVVHRYRSYYTIEEWETLIIEDIDNGCPILYHGQSPNGGHAFVLDGYNSEGYVHINWGWNGMSNGYFMLHALTPEKQGIGGFTGGYNSGQGAVFGIQPNKGNKVTYEITANSLYIEANQYNLGEQISAVASGVSNGGWDIASFSIGYMIYDENNNLVECINSKNLTIGGSSTAGSQNVAFTLPTTLKEGKYYLYLAHTNAYGEWERVAMNVNTQPYYIFQVDNNQASFIVEELGEIYAASVVCNEENIYSKRFSTFTITMGNSNNHEYYGSIYVSIFNSTGKFEQRKSDAIALSIPAHKEITLEIPIKIEVSKGNYCIFITDENKNKLSESYPITVLAEPTNAELKVDNFTLTNTAQDQLTSEYTITNNGGDYTGKLRSWVLFTSHQATASLCNTEEVTIKQGETMTFKQTWTFDDGVVGEKYICTLWYEDNRNGGMTQMSSEEVHFTLQEGTGVESVTNTHLAIYPNPAQEYININNDSLIEVVTIYNMQGCIVATTQCNNNSATIDVATLPAGTYIVVATTAQGNIVEKVVIL